MGCRSREVPLSPVGDVRVLARLRGAAQDHWLGPYGAPLGHANITWVIRWDDMSQRDAAWEELWENPEWKEIWSRHPGFDGYRQLSVRFLEEV